MVVNIDFGTDIEQGETAVDVQCVRDVCSPIGADRVEVYHRILDWRSTNNELGERMIDPQRIGKRFRSIRPDAISAYSRLLPRIRTNMELGERMMVLECLCNRRRSLVADLRSFDRLPKRDLIPIESRLMVGLISSARETARAPSAVI